MEGWEVYPKRSGEESNKDVDEILENGQQHSKMASYSDNSGLPTWNNKNTLDTQNDVTKC